MDITKLLESLGQGGQPVVGAIVLDQDNPGVQRLLKDCAAVTQKPETQKPRTRSELIQEILTTQPDIRRELEEALDAIGG